jgi:hypothetical protein
MLHAVPDELLGGRRDMHLVNPHPWGTLLPDVGQ